jgi:hypothetical protein
MTTAPAADWLADYLERSRQVAGDLGTLFQQALVREKPDEIGVFRRKTASLRYLQQRRRTFPHRIVLFAYASRFDPDFARRTLGARLVERATIDGLPAGAALERKSAELVPALWALAHSADIGAGHYAAALMSGPEWQHWPLVWDVPSEDEARTGFPRDAMWWLTFQYLCEIAHAIVAYVGVTPLMLEELRHIRQNPRLARRLVSLDGDLKLYFADDPGHGQWPLDQLALLLQQIDAATARRAAQAGMRLRAP